MSTYRYTPSASERRRRQKLKARFFIIALLLLVVIIASMPSQCSERSSIGPLSGDSQELEMVRTNPGLDETLVYYTGMTVSYNPVKHVPNWVAYELTAEEADGQEPRYKTFMVDGDVKGCATPDDYRNTGFDRGHMAPAADMKWNQDAMRESFYMTNIAPQANALNRGAWSRLEDKCRQRARLDSAIIIIAGPVLTDPDEMHIGATGVVVPQRFFKVILSPYATPPSAIGFIMPNSYVDGGMQACAVPVDSVEKVTGHDFFSTLPDDIEDQLESKINFTRWSQMK